MFKIITDSSCDLPLEFIEQEEIEIIPINIEIDGQLFADRKDPEELKSFYGKIQAGKLAKTSQVNVGMFAKIFKQYAEEGTEIIYVGFSSGMSGTFQSAVQARDIVLEDYPDAKIQLIDSLGGGGGLGLMIMDTARLRAESWTLNTVAEWLNNHRLDYYHLFTLKHLEYLVRGGRVSKASGTVGELLKIHPVLGLDQDGKITAMHKTRSSKKSFSYMVKTAVENTRVEGPINFIIATSDNIGVGEYLRDQILNLIPAANVYVIPLGATLTGHTGLETTALFFASSTDRK